MNIFLTNFIMSVLLILPVSIQAKDEVNQVTTVSHQGNLIAQSKNPSLSFYSEVHTANAFLDKDKEKPIYTEKHTAVYRSGKIETSTNEYFNLNREKIAELNSDYSKSLIMPTYIFRDFRTGFVEGLRWVDGRYFIFRQEKGKPEEQNLLDNRENVFSCQGWHYYLIANLEHLQKKPLQMKLIFPSKLDYYSFQIKLLDTESNLMRFRLEFDNWFMRLFAPYLDLTYDKTAKKILQYYGPSNILDDRGEIQNVYIFYESAG